MDIGQVFQSEKAEDDVNVPPVGHPTMLTHADWPTPDPAQTIRFMIWNHTISLQTIQFSDQTIQFYSKPYKCLSNHLYQELGKYII